MLNNVISTNVVKMRGKISHIYVYIYIKRICYRLHSFVIIKNIHLI